MATRHGTKARRRPAVSAVTVDGQFDLMNFPGGGSGKKSGHQANDHLITFPR
jgi:hypothetical protein